MNRKSILALGLICTSIAAASSAEPDPAASALARDVLRELISINTTDSVGSVTRAAEAMRARLHAAGFPDADLHVLGPNERKKNLVVRLHGTGAHRPILLIGHLDVVEAPRLEWSTDPFELTERDGYFYGRGVSDMKDGDAILVTTLLRFKREGFKPDRDLIVALTADEEGGRSNGVEWLVKEHRDLIDAEWVINEDSESVYMRHDVPEEYQLGATEKLYADYLLSTANPGGHSSLPVPQNAIYELTAGLARLQQYRFPVELNAVTRAYFERMAPRQTGERAADMRAILRSPPDEAAAQRLSQDPLDNALLHTTCVATRLSAGQANNALPQAATAIVNCRILPGHSGEETRQELIRVLADPHIRVQYVADDGQVSDRGTDRKSMPATALVPEYLQPLEALVGQMWPGIPVIPTMSVGASDDIYTRAGGMPSYIITGIAINRDDIRDHARDERLEVRSFYRGNEFIYRYLESITSGARTP